MNNVTLIGNLASDVETSEVGGRKFATFTLAVARPGRDIGEDLVEIAVWDRQAEVCAEYLEKGRRVAVDGRLHTPAPRDVEVVANRVQFLGAGESVQAAE